MASNVSLTSLALSVTTLADNHRLPFTAITQFINSGYQQLYDKLTDAVQDYNISVTSFSTNSTTNTYPLPLNFYKSRGVDVLWQGTAGTQSAQYLPLKPFIWKDRNLYNNSYFMASLAPGPYYKYHIQGNSNIILTPYPNAVNSIRLSYVPTPTLLVNGGDTMDGIQGFEQYVINFAAMQCLINERKDVSFIAQMQQLQEERIAKMAATVDDGEPKQIAAASESEDRFGDLLGTVQVAIETNSSFQGNPGGFSS